MINTKYVVHSDIDENNIYAEFNILEDAIDYAKGSDNGIADKTYVDAVEVEFDEDGTTTGEDSETVWSYLDELDDDSLEEDAHATKAQPELDRVRSYNDALRIAKEENKPVIYGYMGSDHHGENRYFKLDNIVCDDITKCSNEVMKKYHPNGSILVAYPDKSFVDESLEDTVPEDLADDRTPIIINKYELEEPLDGNEMRAHEAGIDSLEECGGNPSDYASDDLDAAADRYAEERELAKQIAAEEAAAEQAKQLLQKHADDFNFTEDIDELNGSSLNITVRKTASGNNLNYYKATLLAADGPHTEKILASSASGTLKLLPSSAYWPSEANKFPASYPVAFESVEDAKKAIEAFVAEKNTFNKDAQWVIRQYPQAHLDGLKFKSVTLDLDCRVDALIGVPQVKNENINFHNMVEAMEENEDEVECACCNELFAKTDCVHENGYGWVCPDCQAGTSHDDKVETELFDPFEDLY